MNFPNTRMRRLRKDENIRKILKEINLQNSDLIKPFFVKEGIEEEKLVSEDSGIYHHSIDSLLEKVEKCVEEGIRGILLFGIPEEKDKTGYSAYKENGIVQKAIEKIKNNYKITIFSDVCLCHYTSHGHCGIISNGEIDNDETLDVLSKIALSHAKKGADFVCPSSMMDGQVRKIRTDLDEEGFENVGIMSYSSKFNSSFYSPFRSYAENEPETNNGNLEDRSTYQMDYSSKFQPIREISLDIEEGADITMVKPALPYLDIISKAKEKFNVPISAYQVSGEYSMMKQGAINTSLNEKEIFLESLSSIKRAGANFIITYNAIKAARWLNENKNRF